MGVLMGHSAGEFTGIAPALRHYEPWLGLQAFCEVRKMVTMLGTCLRLCLQDKQSRSPASAASSPHRSCGFMTVCKYDIYISVYIYPYLMNSLSFSLCLCVYI